MLALKEILLLVGAVYLSEAAEPRMAYAEFTPAEGQQVTGWVTFTERFKPNSDVVDHIEYNIDVEGLTEGPHGFHIHEIGSIAANCKAAGRHFNPNKKNHGAPWNEDRHVGDLGNLNATKHQHGTLKESKGTDRLIRLDGPNSILNRAVVIHSDKDDLGKGGFEDSKTTGHAGSRLACGIIKLVQQ